jgi:hypothetical protein
MNSLFIKLVLFVIFILNINQGVSSSYFEGAGLALFRRTTALRTAQPIIYLGVVTDLKLLPLSEITKLADAQAVGLWLKGASGFYESQVRTNSKLFKLPQFKMGLTEALSSDLSRLTGGVNPAIPINHLRALLFNDHAFKENVRELVNSGLSYKYLSPEEAISRGVRLYYYRDPIIDEAIRLGRLFYQLQEGPIRLKRPK